MKKILNANVISKLKENKKYCDGEDVYCLSYFDGNVDCRIKQNGEEYYTRTRYKDVFNNMKSIVSEELEIGDPYCGFFSVPSVHFGDWNFYDRKTKCHYGDDHFVSSSDFRYTFDGRYFKSYDNIFWYDSEIDRVYINFDGLHEIYETLDVEKQVIPYFYLYEQRIKGIGEEVKRAIESSIKVAGYEAIAYNVVHSFKIGDYIKENSLSNRSEGLYYANSIRKDYMQYYKFMSKKRDGVIKYVEDFRNMINNFAGNEKTNKRIREKKDNKN